MHGPTQAQCTGITKTGSRCKSWALPESAYCLTHDPNRVTDLAEYRRRGGKGKSHEARARKAMTGGLKDVSVAQAVLLRVLARLYRGDFDPGVATAMASVARAINDLAKTGAQAEFEERLGRIERDLAEVPA